MFIRSLNMFAIGTFNKEDYKKIINNIERSKGYIAYIDSKKERGITNKRYEKYLDNKLALYAIRPPHLKGKKESLYFSVVNKNVDSAKLDSWEKMNGGQDDYYLEQTHLEVEGERAIIHKSTPVEMSMFNNALEVNNHLERINREQLSESFIMNKHRRFMLLPFTAKNNEKFVEPLIIANIYDTGVVTIQLYLTTEHDELIELPENPPRSIQFDEARFYKSKSNYLTKNFWEKDVILNLTADDIMTYYEDQLSKLGDIDVEFSQENRSVSWVFNDFKLHKHPDHMDFVKQNKKLYLSHLLNGNKEVIDRYSVKKTEEILDESEIISNKHVYYICNSHSSILSFGYSAFLTATKKSLEDKEEELKTDNLYDESVLNMLKSYSLIFMFEYLRFYELTLIRKYFTKELIKNISNNKYKTLNDYNSIRKDFNIVKLQHDEEILFQSEGSAKSLYIDILEKSNVNKLVDKAEDIVKGVREDTLNLREHHIKNNETLILMITTLLTIVLGYRGIKSIIYEVAVYLPLLGNTISKHPLRTTIIIWCELIVMMLFLNIKRWWNNKK
ncbi:hypothetical protein ACIQLG_16330 [Terribacillus saccharophilus]|uniref:hypothetical protein n=1 Tax=Terribacillus saccharophilus TaxID=361277 RepID=UPI00380D6F9D